MKSNDNVTYLMVIIAGVFVIFAENVFQRVCEFPLGMGESSDEETNHMFTEVDSDVDDGGDSREVIEYDLENAASTWADRQSYLSSPLSDDKVYRNAVKDRMVAERKKQKSDALNKLERAYKEKTFLIVEMENLKREIKRARAENLQMKQDISAKNMLVKKGSEMTSHAMQDLLHKYFVSRQRECMLRLRMGYERMIFYGFQRWLLVTLYHRTRQKTGTAVKERLGVQVNKLKREVEEAKMAEKAAWQVLTKVKRGQGAGTVEPMTLAANGSGGSGRTSRANSASVRTPSAFDYPMFCDTELRRSLLLNQAREIATTVDGSTAATTPSSSGAVTSGKESKPSSPFKYEVHGIDANGDETNNRSKGKGKGSGSVPLPVDSPSPGAVVTTTASGKKKVSYKKKVDPTDAKSLVSTTSSIAELVEDAIAELSTIDDGNLLGDAGFNDVLSTLSTTIGRTPRSPYGRGGNWGGSPNSKLGRSGDGSTVSNVDTGSMASHMRPTRGHFHGGATLSDAARRVARLKGTKLATKFARMGGVSNHDRVGDPHSSPTSKSSSPQVKGIESPTSYYPHTAAHEAETSISCHSELGSNPLSRRMGSAFPSPPKPEGMERAQYELIYGVSQTWRPPARATKGESPRKWMTPLH